MFEEELQQIQDVTTHLCQDSNANVAFVIDRNGKMVAGSGDFDKLDTTSLASNIPARAEIAKRLKEDKSAFYADGTLSIHVQLVADCLILIVTFGLTSTLGLVRLRVRTSIAELNGILEALLRKAQATRTDMPFATISNQDIDNLFSD